MKAQYVEERFPRYMIFGESPDGIHVDVADTERDVAQHLTRECAAYLISERDRAVDKIIQLVNRLEDLGYPTELYT